MDDYNKSIHQATITVGKLICRTFKKMIFNGPSFSFEKLNDNPVMVVCSHRSHLDYLLLGIELHKAGLQNLRFAAGDNLTKMPYLGKKFISWGAFPVYRARSHRRNYIHTLCQQVVTMLIKGDKVIVFPEGGRSYKGNMMEMRNGIMAANIFAQFQTPEQKFYFLPLTISYEKLPELLYFDALQKGNKIRKGNKGIISSAKGSAYYYGADIIAFLKFLLARKCGHHYGEVYIDYNEPIAISDIVDVQKYYISGMRNNFSAHKIAIQKVSTEVKDQFVQLYRILPQHIVASIIKQYGLVPKPDMIQYVPEIVATLKERKHNCQSLVSFNENDIIEQGIHQLEFSKALISIRKKLKICRPQIINYYAASLTHN